MGASVHPASFDPAISVHEAEELQSYKTKVS